MEEAIVKAAELAKLDAGDRGVTYLERPTSFKEQLLDMLAQQERDEGAVPADGFAFLGNGQQKLAQALADIRSILTGPTIQVRCLECPSAAPARVERRDVGLLASLGEWLS
jgi:protease-4